MTHVPQDVAAGGTALTEPELVAWGRAFGRALPSGAVIALHGDLGAGKTTLVRALCEGLDVHEAVTSPTFAVLHEYAAAGGTVVHADLYRLRRPSELEQLGWDELLARARAVLVEWPDQGGEHIPAAAMHLHLAHVPGDPERRLLRLLPRIA